MTRGLWNRETVALVLLAACLPVAMQWVRYEGLDALLRWVAVALTLGVWHLLFMLVRAQPPSFAALLTALAIAMLAPEELGLFRLALGISFGVVMGELVFGGWGRNVVHPATVTLAFLGFGFPEYNWPELIQPIAWAVIPTALIGAFSGTMPAAVLGSTLLVLGIAFINGVLPDGTLWAAAIILVLLVADPVTSAATTLGRWLNGSLYALLVLLFASSWSGAAPVQIAVAAALLSSLAAPLLDEVAVALWISARRRGHDQR